LVGGLVKVSVYALGFYAEEGQAVARLKGKSVTGGGTIRITHTHEDASRAILIIDSRRTSKKCT
jgi:hypothetical protein